MAVRAARVTAADRAVATWPTLGPRRVGRAIQGADPGAPRSSAVNLGRPGRARVARPRRHNRAELRRGLWRRVRPAPTRPPGRHRVDAQHGAVPLIPRALPYQVRSFAAHAAAEILDQPCIGHPPFGGHKAARAAQRNDAHLARRQHRIDGRADRAADAVGERAARQIGDRLTRELETNVALKVRDEGIGFVISGRGELHLSVLIESLRREGFEFEVGRPQVVTQTIDGVESEPVEELLVETGPEFVGTISQELGQRRAELTKQEQTSSGATRTTYILPTRAMIGLRNLLLTATKGTVIMHSLPHGYQPMGAKLNATRSGALMATEAGTTTPYALDAAEARGELFVGPGTTVYPGMIVGQYNRQEDLEINVCRAKQLTNMRSSSSDGTVQLTPFTNLSLEQCIDFIADDELLEVTPKSLRLRKRYLDPNERKRHKK